MKIDHSLTASIDEIDLNPASFLARNAHFTPNKLALIYEDRCVAINLPVAVELLVTKCDPAARGNSATSREKPATVETGLVVMVPEYLEEGEMIKIDTRTGQFLGRANK